MQPSVLQWTSRRASGAWLVPLASSSPVTGWLNHLLPVESHVIPLTTNWHLLSLFVQQMKSTWRCSTPVTPVSKEPPETTWPLE